MKKLALIIPISLFSIALAFVVIMYNRVYRDNTILDEGEVYELLIPTGSDSDFVYNKLASENIIRNNKSFLWVARKKNYPNHVYPGRYLIRAGMSNNGIISLLRSGEQEPVQLVFHNIRSPEMLARVISAQIEADSSAIMSLFSNEQLAAKNGLIPETMIGIFIPNTYEFYWNTSEVEFFERMMREYRLFWNENRVARAERIGFEPMEVIILASIVDEETIKPEEEARVAGVYINRLNKRIRLQADPTVKFAAGDMNITRVLKKHLEIDSPYNTYRHGGLPPGPIVIPSISAIEAVLDYEHHDYLYFCAREDFSGYHNFAKTLTQHNKNARSYQNALDRRKIFN